jgi:hypothetical protein
VEGGQIYPVIDEARDEFTAGCPAFPRTETERKFINTAEENNIKAAGICWMQSNRTAVATSTGNLDTHGYTFAGNSFQQGSIPSRDVVWIEKGILKSLLCDRFTAQKTGKLLSSQE